MTKGFPTLNEGFRYSKKRTGATVLICKDCGQIADTSQPYWDISKTKAMHEKGTGHSTLYVHFTS